MISSTKNEQVKTVIELKKKAKARNEAKLFVVEGVRMVSELPKERTEKLYVSESFLNNPENEKFLKEYYLLYKDDKLVHNLHRKIYLLLVH